MIIRFLFCLMFICPSLSVKCQNIFRKGIVIQTSGDSLHGFIKLQGKRFAPEKILFRQHNKSTDQQLSIADVDAIMLPEYRFYKKIKLNENDVLSQYLIQGDANLYSWNKQFYIEKEGEIFPLAIDETKVSKGTGGSETYIHRKKTYIGILKSVMNDCPSLSTQLDRVSLTEPSLTETVKEYNICVGSNPYIFKEKIPLYRISISPLIGVSYTRLDVSYPNQFYYVYGFFDSMDFEELNISPGIGFNISSPRIDDRVSLYLEARYLKTSFTERVIFPIATFDDNEIKLSYSYLYFPVMVQNDFPIRINQSIYFKFGLLLTFNLSNEYQHTKWASNLPNTNPIVDDNDFDFHSSQTGITGGIGYKIKIGEKSYYFTELRVDNQGVLTNSATINFDPYIFSLFFGVSF